MLNRQQIDAKIIAFIQEFNGLQDPEIYNEDKMKQLQKKILDFFIEAAKSLNDIKPLTNYQKKRLIVSLKSLRRQEFRRGLGNLFLSMTNEREINPKIKYRENIVNTTIKSLINDAKQIKDEITNGSKL